MNRRSARTRLRPSPPAALALAAHPDDIEFYMAGTLLLLKKAGYQIHYLTLANGSCGSLKQSARLISRIRLGEAKAAAALLGAKFYPPLVNDLEIVYALPLLRQVAALVRRVKPEIVLTHSPQDYMEDHVNCCRLALTAAFARGMPNFRTTPAAAPQEEDVTVYHAMPHGLRDPLRQRVRPGCFVQTTSVHPLKRRALAAHVSQKAWLDATQGMDSYLLAMDTLSLDVGRMSRRFEHAEGWRRHLHYGFCAQDADPLHDALGDDFLVDPHYERALQHALPDR